MLKKDKAPSGCRRCEAQKQKGTSCRNSTGHPASSQQNTSFTQKKLHPMARRGLDNLRFEILEIPEAKRTATEDSAVRAIEFLMKNF